MPVPESENPKSSPEIQRVPGPTSEKAASELILSICPGLIEEVVLSLYVAVTIRVWATHTFFQSSVQETTPAPKLRYKPTSVPGIRRKPIQGSTLKPMSPLQSVTLGLYSNATLVHAWAILNSILCTE